jgi:hypothetical protein
MRHARSSALRLAATPGEVPASAAQAEGERPRSSPHSSDARPRATKVGGNSGPQLHRKRPPPPLTTALAEGGGTRRVRSLGATCRQPSSHVTRSLILPQARQPPPQPVLRPAPKSRPPEKKKIKIKKAEGQTANSCHAQGGPRRGAHRRTDASPRQRRNEARFAARVPRSDAETRPPLSRRRTTRRSSMHMVGHLVADAVAAIPEPGTTTRDDDHGGGGGRASDDGRRFIPRNLWATESSDSLG